jgi:hypothetical protein
MEVTLRKRQQIEPVKEDAQRHAEEKEGHTIMADR